MKYRETYQTCLNIALYLPSTTVLSFFIDVVLALFATYIQLIEAYI